MLVTPGRKAACPPQRTDRGALADAHAAGFSLEELRTVHRYLGGMAEVMGTHAEDLEA